MKTLNRFPFNQVAVIRDDISLAQALSWARHHVAQTGNPTKVASLACWARKKVIPKPRGRLGFTFAEWSKSFQTGGPAFHQGR